MKFLVLQHHEALGPGNLEEWLRQRGHTWETCHFDKPLDASHQDHEGLIVLGGPMHVDANQPRLAQELALIHHDLSHHRPILGICLGAQLLAHSLGASVSPMDCPEQGWTPMTTSDNQDLCVAQWHEQQCSLPEGAVLLASSERCKVQMYRYQHHVLATQFHPEWHNEAIRCLHQAFPGECPLEETDPDQEAQFQAWWYQQLDTWFATATQPVTARDREQT